MPEDYVIPYGCDPFIQPEIDTTPFGITIFEASKILEIDDTRVWHLIADQKLRTCRSESGLLLITYDSLEDHLIRSEIYHFKREFFKAKQEIYGDIIYQARMQAFIESRRKLNKEKRLLKRRKPKTPRAKTTKRLRVRLDVPLPPEEYELHD
jgi:hypothetical protein